MFSGKVRNIDPTVENGFYFAIKQNRSNEDWLSISQFGDDCYCYCVFDGHGGGNPQGANLDGKHCVLHLKENFHHHLAKKLNGIHYNDDTRIKKAITDCFHTVDEHLYKNGGLNGSTCSVLIVTPENIISANLGDSRAIKIEETETELAQSLRTKNNLLRKQLFSQPALTFATEVHNAIAETERIKKAGGFIENRRLNSVYLPSRSFGDFDCKIVRGKYTPDGPMSARPAINFLPLTPGLLILGSDGIFDGFDDLDTLVEKVKNNTKVEEVPGTLLEHAMARNGEDDTTCIVIII
jgi:serine/threonine protein phosphatase PrpC